MFQDRVSGIINPSYKRNSCLVPCMNSQMVRTEEYICKNIKVDEVTYVIFVKDLR